MRGCIVAQQTRSVWSITKKVQIHIISYSALETNLHSPKNFKDQNQRFNFTVNAKYVLILMVLHALRMSD
jgi:hypothetical protein